MEDGQHQPQSGVIAAEFATRLGRATPSRLGEGVGRLVAALQALTAEMRITPEEMRAALAFLAELGHYADARRQEWVLLADALGLSSLVEDLAHQRPQGATPNTLAGPFYRADAPDLALGADLSRDGIGVPLAVRGRVVNLSGAGLGGALVEVWQANSAGKYENQEPDGQPEHNLRGRFCADAQGRFAFRSVMPKGYALPADGPAGRLLTALGLGLERPAHLHFRVAAEGHEKLTTHIFDRADPAIGRDAIFGVKPELLAEFRPADAGAGARTLDLKLVLCPLRQG
jgi:hydroxyquinol 1,2-dioxygenase